MKNKNWKEKTVAALPAFSVNKKRNRGGGKMYRRGKNRWLKHFDFMMLDMLCLELAFMAACIIRNGFGWPFENDSYAKLGIIIMLLHVCVVFFLDSYKNIVKRSYLTEIRSVVKHNTTVLCAAFVYLFATKETAIYSRIIISLMWGIGCCIMIVARLGWKRVVRMQIRKGKKRRTVLVVSESCNIEHIIETFQRQHYENFIISGIVVSDQDMTGKKVKSVPVVASKDEALKYVKENVIDEVFLALQEDEPYADLLINHFINMGVTVHIQLATFGKNIENKVIEHFGGYTVLSMGTKFASDWQLMVKRVMDVTGALVGLILTGVIFVIFAPIIYRESPGPVFFAQERVGRNGRTFQLYKFRSMYPDAEARKQELMEQNKMNGLMFKMDDDPRIIPIGRFMRKTSLDEFPQFWNVLKGDMSLVGTRPPTVDEYEQYELHHKMRLATKPGITGMWQVSGRSNIVDFEEVVALDAKYISEWDLGLDLKILWKTLKVLAEGEGAY